MTANQKISLALLLGRLITVGIYLVVINKQYKFLHAKSYPALRKLRVGLLIGTAVVIVGNIIPIVIDFVGVLGGGSFGLLLAYVFSNNITALLSAYIVLYNLNLTQKIKISDDLSKNLVMNKLKESRASNASLKSKLNDK